MNKKNSRDWTYYLIAILLMAMGFGAVHLGVNILEQNNIAVLGYWLMLLSVVIFFGRNFYYMVEQSDPDKRIA